MNTNSDSNMPSGSNISSQGSDLAAPNQTNVNVWAIVGGAVGGAAALAIMISMYAIRTRICSQPQVKFSNMNLVLSLLGPACMTFHVL